MLKLCYQKKQELNKKKRLSEWVMTVNKHNQTEKKDITTWK